MPPKLPKPPIRPFRILALPLVRLPLPASQRQPCSSPSTSSTPKTPLLLFQVLQPNASPETGPPNLATRALQKASDTWLKLGLKPKDSWMRWFYDRGEGLMDRIEYEEWALKAIVEGQGVRVAKEGETQERVEISLLKPQLEQPLPPLLPKLHRLLLHRIPYHRKMLIRSLAFTPVTLPFALIPIIPNFPLFYVLWRAWSHYKAWRGASYLESLLKRGFIAEKPSSELDQVYRRTASADEDRRVENRAPDQTSSDGVAIGRVQEKSRADERMEVDEETVEMPEQALGNGPAPDGTSTPASMVYQAKAGPPSTSSTGRLPMLLGLGQTPLIARAFALKPNEVMDLNRAVEQAETRARAAMQAVGERDGQRHVPSGITWRGNLHR